MLLRSFASLLTILPLSFAEFHHRTDQSSIVVNTVLYYDGGEIITWSGSGTGYVSNSSSAADFLKVAENYTYAIDLTSPWTNRSVTVHQIDKAAPVLNRAALWLDKSAQAFYAYDGYKSFSQNDADPRPSIPSNQLWKFTPSRLAGSWSQVNLEGNATNLVRVGESSYGSGGGLAFALGGQISAATTESIAVSDPAFMQSVSGMVMYNMTSNEWYNATAGFDYARGVWLGSGLYVPSFGPQGVFFSFAGATSTLTDFVAFDNAFVFEPASQQWALQQVSGAKPPPSLTPCIVGAQGDNGTYEIFLYGGLQITGTTHTSDGAVYVLSLPSFNWHKTSATVSGRYRHTCSVGGHRQMISIGGRVIPGPLTSEDSTYGAPDPWPNSIGAFDMSKLQWTSSFDSDASSYVTSDTIKAHTASNGQYPSSWTSTKVKEWFTSDYAVTGTATSSTPSPSVSEAASANIGTIVGGAVGGGLALILLIVLVFVLIWCSQRRKRYRAGQTDPARSPTDPYYAGSSTLVDNKTNGSQTAYNPEIYSHPAELHDKSTVPEADGIARYELPAGVR